MAVVLSPSKKKSRAEYFREYRRRKFTGQGKLRLMEAKTNRKTQSSSSLFSLSQLQLHRFGLILIAICTTAYLVYVSASYFEGPPWLRFGLALLSEIILLVFVTLNPATLIDRLLRSGLLLAFLVYSILPFVTEPLKKHTDQLRAQNLIIQERESLQREIIQMNSEHQKLLEHERLTRAHSVAQQLAALEFQLRATFINDRTVAQQGEGQRLPSWVLAVQRLLFVFFNLFLVHYLSATGVAQQNYEATATLVQKKIKLQHKPQLHLISKTNYSIIYSEETSSKFNLWSRFKFALRFFIEGNLAKFELSQSG